jgi:phosphoglycolate phosphatase
LSESLETRPPHEAQRTAALALFRRVYAQGLFKRGRVFPGVEQTLQSLAQKGVALCCITNKERTFTVPLLEQAGLARYFAFTVCADRPEDRKPSPNMLLAACSRFGVTPAEMLYVGDSRIDIEAARAAGCPVVTVGYGYDGDREAIATQADRSIVSMTDLLTPGAAS